MFEPDLPLDREDSIKRFEALLTADCLSIDALQTNLADFASPIEALDASLQWLSGLFESFSKRRDAMKQISLERFNARLPITRSLFPDVFPAVVEYLQDMERTDRRVISISWARVSHVCRQWRLSTLEMAALWARDPAIFGRKGFECVLGRTNDLPIDLVFDPRREIPFTPALLSRLRKLTCSSQLPFKPELLGEQLFPQLEELNLAPPFIETFPWQLAAHPRLRAISFTGIFTSTFPVMKSLVDLWLQAIPADTLTTTKLMLILQDAPLLRTLVVSRDLSFQRLSPLLLPLCPPSSSFSSIFLPQLKSIHLDHICICEAWHILSHSNTTEVKVLGTNRMHRRDETPNSVLSLLQTFSATPNFVSNLTCSIKHGFNRNSMDLINSDGGFVETELFHGTGEGTLAEATRNLVGSAFAARVVTLDLSKANLYGISVQSWRSLFAELAAVAQVVVQLFVHHSALEAPFSALIQPDESGRLAAPRIQTISLRASKEPVDANLLLLLLQVISYRRERGMPLDRLQMVGGDMAGFDKFVYAVQKASTFDLAVNRKERCIVFN